VLNYLSETNGELHFFLHNYVSVAKAKGCSGALIWFSVAVFVSASGTTSCDSCAAGNM
jgi:hypothetical protein